MPYFHFRTHAGPPKDDGHPKNEAQPEDTFFGDDGFAEAAIEGIKAFADGKETISLEELRAETG